MKLSTLFQFEHEFLNENFFAVWYPKQQPTQNLFTTSGQSLDQGHLCPYVLVNFRYYEWSSRILH